jgi:hypothetical protein
MISAPVCVELAWVLNEAFVPGATCAWTCAEFLHPIVMASSGSVPSDKDGSGNKPDDIVITPGGPRRRDQVHPVGPGETVRRNQDGTYTVVPKPTPDSNEKPPGRE